MKTGDVESFNIDDQETEREKKSGIFDCFRDCFGLFKKNKKNSLLLKN